MRVTSVQWIQLADCASLHTVERIPAQVKQWPGGGNQLLQLLVQLSCVMSHAVGIPASHVNRG